MGIAICIFEPLFAYRDSLYANEHTRRQQMRGNVIISGCVAKDNGVRRADARQRWHNKRQCNNQPAH
jgi:hypothetical protein